MAKGRRGEEARARQDEGTTASQSGEGEKRRRGEGSLSGVETSPKMDSMFKSYELPINRQPFHGLFFEEEVHLLRKMVHLPTNTLHLSNGSMQNIQKTIK